MQERRGVRLVLDFSDSRRLDVHRLLHATPGGELDVSVHLRATEVVEVSWSIRACVRPNDRHMRAREIAMSDQRRDDKRGRCAVHQARAHVAFYAAGSACGAHIRPRAELHLQSLILRCVSHALQVLCRLLLACSVASAHSIMTILTHMSRLGSDQCVFVGLALVLGKNRQRHPAHIGFERS